MNEASPEHYKLILSATGLTALGKARMIVRVVM